MEENVLQRSVVLWHITKSTYMIRKILKDISVWLPTVLSKFLNEKSTPPSTLPPTKVTKPPLCTALVIVFNQCSVIATLSRYLGEQWSAKSI